NSSTQSSANDRRSIPLLVHQPTPHSTLFPYTTLFRSSPSRRKFHRREQRRLHSIRCARRRTLKSAATTCAKATSTRRSTASSMRSEEHTSELQSRFDLVCRLLLEKKKHDPHRARRPCV